MTSRHTLIAFAGLLFFGIAWGTTQPLTKVAVSTGYQPFGLIFWQLFLSAVILGVIIVVRGIPVPLTARHLVFYATIAVIGTLLPNSFSYLAAAQLPAGIMAVAITTVPMFSLMIALAIGNERFRLRRSLGILLGVAAMLLIAVPEASLPEPEKSVWVFIALIAPLCYGMEGNYVARFQPGEINPLATLFAASIVGLVPAIPLALLSGQWVDLTKSWEAPEWAILGSAIAHTIAYSGYFWLVRYAGVVFTAQIAYIVTIGAIAIAIVFLKETYSGWVWLAVGLMLVGLTFVQPVGRLPQDIPDDADLSANGS